MRQQLGEAVVSLGGQEAKHILQIGDVLVAVQARGLDEDRGRGRTLAGAK